MSVELYVNPGAAALSWDAFRETYPPCSIALDGYVSGPPDFDPIGPFRNFNHHEGVDRLATLSTAQQVLRAARMGLRYAFERDGVFEPNVYVNDCDQDVCAAVYLLRNLDKAEQIISPALNRFIEVAGTLDATAGLYPYPTCLSVLEEQAWVFQPYRQARINGEIAKHDPIQHQTIIDEVGTRIDQHIAGKGETSPLDFRYETIGGGPGWTMIRPIGSEGHMGAVHDGALAYVAVQELGNNRRQVSLGRLSTYVPFDIPAYLAAFNIAEGCTNDRWGGGDTTAGSPRQAGTSLSLEAVQQIINNALQAGEDHD